MDMSELLQTRMSGFDSVMGFRLVRATTEEVVLEYDVDEKHHQPYGIVHGGVHCATVETVCSIGAGLNAMARGQGVVGLENHTSFIRAVRRGRVRVTGTPITRGRRSQVWEAVARNEAGEVVATGRLRLLCLDPGTELAGEKVT